MADQDDKLLALRTTVAYTVDMRELVSNVSLMHILEAWKDNLSEPKTFSAPERLSIRVRTLM